MDPRADGRSPRHVSERSVAVTISASVVLCIHPDDLRAGRFDRVGCVYQI